MPLGAFKAALMGTAGVSTGDVVLLSSQTADSSTVLDFTSGITSTYGEYIFKFYNINPDDDNESLTFQCNAADSTSYNEYITSTYFDALHTEADDDYHGYRTDKDQPNTQLYNFITNEQGNGADESAIAEMHLFNPASTTYVKHFYIVSNGYRHDDMCNTLYIAGYINQTKAIDDIQFKMTDGDFDGTIKMWGVK